jgi:hypothetical protein
MTVRTFYMYAPTVTVTTKGTRKPRKPTLVSVSKQASKAGLEVARYEIDQDWKIAIVPGKPMSPEIPSNDTSDIDPKEWN